MANQGVAFELAEACLARQVGNAVVQAYQRSSMLQRRRPIMSAWAAFLSGEADSNVVSLKAARSAGAVSPAGSASPSAKPSSRR